MAKAIHAVTGAFGYSGKYIAKRLLDQGCQVITLTHSINRANPFNGRVTPHAFNFDDPDALVASLRNVAVLYNTYWVRFNHKMFQHADAVKNTLILFDAAKAAGVERIVHVSITNPSKDSHLEYFSGKAKLEDALTKLGVSYAILRPAVLFGKEDILINNIAWALRKLPVFGVFGNGQYRLQPIHVDDFAALAVVQGVERENVTINAIGPETFTYKNLVKMIGRIIGKQRPVVCVPASFGFAAGWVLGKLVRDVVITRDEIAGLMADLLYAEAPPAGKTRLTDWAQVHAESLGRRYASELARRRDRTTAYHDVHL